MKSSDSSPEPGIPAATNASDPGRLERLEQQLTELSSRLGALERSVRPARPEVAAAPGPAGAPAAADQTLTFGGRVRSGRTMVASYRRSVDDVLAADPDAAARLFAALANPARVALLQALIDGPRTSQQLRGVLDDPSAGQLYHHLKELLAAGLVIQPGRSHYALRRGSPVELCILILAAANLASAAGPYPEPADDSAQPAGPA